MKKTFFKGIGFGVLSAMLLMFSLLLLSCEKEIPIEDLQPGDLYSDGTISGFVVVSFLITPEDQAAPNTLHIISEHDIGPCYGTDVYQYEKDGWRVPVNGELLTMSRTAGLWDANHNFNLSDSYWGELNGLNFFQRNGGIGFNPDDGNEHRLRLYQIIQF